MTHWSLSNGLFSLQLFAYFLLLSLLLSSSFIALWPDRMFSYIFWGLLCVVRYDLFCRKFHGLLRRMCFMLLLDEIFYRHQLGPFDLWCQIVLGFLCWFFCLDDLSVGDRWVLNSPTTTVLESLYAFTSFSVRLIKLGALILGAYRLIIVISFSCIGPFIIMKCPSLSHLTNISLKSTFSDIIIATLACFGGSLAC
jgi:hypothetical protein